MDNILLFLLKIDAHKRRVLIGTNDIGQSTNMSQQNASRRLRLLEKNGLIEKKDGQITITKKGLERIREEYSIMKKAFEGKIEITGIIVDGLGEGKYYMSLDGYRNSIKEKLGFDPFPGTLNVKIDPGNRTEILSNEPIIIPGFTDKQRTYGDIFAFPCKIEGNDCAIVVPLRTSHGPDIIEIIADFEIKRKNKIKAGEKIKVLL